MKATKRKLSLSFPQKLIREPILHSIATKFQLVFIILKANVTDECGYLEISLEGTEEAMDRALEYLRQRGVTIEENQN